MAGDGDKTLGLWVEHALSNEKLRGCWCGGGLAVRWLLGRLKAWRDDQSTSAGYEKQNGTRFQYRNCYIIKSGDMITGTRFILRLLKSIARMLVDATTVPDAAASIRR
ncbi:hypothetical protein CISIN_1g033980mg [Citrus sinensis]|uniref:Uncharacterized protein n=1 Tax=Citrus sinensis TaxID=2711 RepID=A0A067D6Q6_CITSI|nr:hypothetical protein CISIN_1g033980mg [Citrus sinensis]